MNEKFPCVRDIKSGENIAAPFLVSSSSRKEAKNGPFWLLELQDVTGSLEARIWSPLSRSFSDIPVGSIVSIEGRTETYRDKVQLVITRLNILDQNERADLDMSRLVPSSRVSAEDMLAEIEGCCQTVLQYKPWRVFVQRVLEDRALRSRLLEAPAARGIHHAWTGGLLEHTLGVVRLCMKMAELYPMLDRQILLVAAIFHDIGKLWEFSGDLAPDYSDEGRLLGHISIGLARLDEPLRAAGVSPELALHFKHLIASHHGQLEFGSPRLPQTAEAFALHYADNLDAKLTQCQTLLEELPSGTSWTSYQKSLDRALFRPVCTPDTQAESGEEESGLVPAPLPFFSEGEENAEPVCCPDEWIPLDIPDFDVMFGPIADEDDMAYSMMEEEMDGFPLDVPVRKTRAAPKRRKRTQAAKRVAATSPVLPAGESALEETGEPAGERDSERQGGLTQCSLV